ncbi:MAG: PSD1 and planctomycete cytochrome C domain-containing protein [Aureliella sp.]
MMRFSQHSPSAHGALIFLRSLAAWAGTLCLLSALPAMAGEPTVDFGRDVLPILSDNCFHCHGPDEKSREADLSLHTSAGALGGESPVVIPGDSAASLLIQRVASDDPDEVMPPPDSKRQLSTAQIELLRKWVEQGAKWDKHWAYQKPVRPELPSNKPAIDAFIDLQIEQVGLTAAPPASRETLIRRLTLDLTGLPPTLEEVDAFLADRSPDAYERVVDRLIQSPRFGERMAWDWLDAARYADTNGFQGDPERTMWPWRDWVVRAFNDDMPYDQFTIEQLAGDMLPEATRDQQLASGFNRNNMHNGEGGRIAEETRVENVFDRVETTATIWLGATFTCCRCHDHKFDPFTLRDYYGLYDIFNQMSENGQGRGGQAPPILNYSTDEEQRRVKETKARHAEVARRVAAFEADKFKTSQSGAGQASEGLPGNLQKPFLQTKPLDRRLPPLLEAVSYFESAGDDPAYVAVLRELVEALRQRDTAAGAVTKVMIMDQLPEPRTTLILSKGAYDKPTDTQVFGAMPASLAEATSASSPASGRASRLDLARWLVNGDNPLTARVTVNRIWQMFFGTGLVKTVEDFGVQGEKPSHAELLDWLAVELMHRGWDIKSLCRSIVTSSAYRRSSHVTPDQLDRDPENRLLARGPRYRLPSWMIRDVALAAGGLLVDRPGGPAVKPYQPEGIWEEATFGKKTYVQDHGAALYRRTLYTFWRRIVGPTMLFDNAARQTCTVKSVRTNTPLHALTTLNETTYFEAARSMAERVLKGWPDDAARIETAFRLATARRPTSVERTILQLRLEELKGHYADHPDEAQTLLSVGESKRDAALDAGEHAAFTGLCSLLLNLDEAISKE